MKDWNADLWLHMIQFLSAKDADHLAACSRRCLYLVRSYQRLRGAELVAATSRITGVRTRQHSLTDVCRQAISQLHSKPNLALCFSKQTVAYGNRDVEEDLPLLLPDSTVIIQVGAESIQACHQGELDCQSRIMLMLGALPDAVAVPFSTESDVQPDFALSLIDTLENRQARADYWKVCMIFATSAVEMAGVQDFIDRLQIQYPHAAIVGGVCESGHISVPCSSHVASHQALSTMSAATILQLFRAVGSSLPHGMVEKQELVDTLWQLLQTKPYLLKPMEDGVFGVVLGGDVPVHSIVSRGVHSLTWKGPPRPSTPLYTVKASFHRPGDSDYMFPGMDAPPYHKIDTIENRETGRIYTIQDLIKEYGRPQMIGLRKPDEDGFDLEGFNPIRASPGSIIFFGEDMGSDALVGRNIDLFELNGEACMEDMRYRMEQLKEAVRDDELLGALMFSCNGRGPQPSMMIPEAMSDARRFALAFPHVTCLGFYAGGEIGPRALAGRQAVFQTGKASLQGFTAVFAVFIVPKVDLSSLRLDDSDKNISSFLDQYWTPTATRTTI